MWLTQSIILKKKNYILFGGYYYGISKLKENVRNGL